MSILLGILTFVLVLVSVFLIMVVLMQRAQSDAGMGAVMGGGMTEATFGANTSSVLSKATINATIIFFVLGTVLFLGRIYQHTHLHGQGAGLPSIAPTSLPAAPALPPAPAPTKK
ncbi:MAG TPA: preprotein translocase subunit SecG [Opitutaceae bacterium]|jgi:preprotein translocase subunit SecG|nr:preprotein translocase subunit SecG [Opitutaceae bacterium]